MHANGEPGPASPPRRRLRLRIIATALTAVVAGSMGAVSATTPASAATVDTDAWYVLVNRNSGKALDVAGNATNDGARLTQWSRHNGANQQWQFAESGDGYYRIKSRHSGKVLDVYNWSTVDGGEIVQWTDHNGTNQQFRLADSDGGYVRLISRHSGKAVDVQGGSTADGANIIQYSDLGGANQQWQLVPVDGGGPPPGGSGCGQNPTLDSGTHTIQSSGQNRSFALRIPANYDNNHPYRLIFAFHWWGGTMNDIVSGGTSGAAWSYYGMQEQSNNSAILVAPQGIGNGWANSGGQDVTFVDDMIRRIESDLCVNPAQRFALGFSYGGAMSYALACARADVFRAVAVYGAPRELSGCSGGTQPIAYFGIHGISDNIASGRSLRDRFVRNNGCTPQNPPEPAQGSLTHITTTYSGCQDGYPVVWAPFDGGHMPGPVDGCACESGVTTWTKGEVWRFFAQFQ